MAQQNVARTAQRGSELKRVPRLLALDPDLAQQIVSRTMTIIGCNVNVMNAEGIIIASGQSDRIGIIHEGALLVLAQSRAVDIDAATACRLQGVQPGVNLPLHNQGQLVGVIGLTGQPSEMHRFGELVGMAAEMLIEQTRLSRLLLRDIRFKEDLVLELIRAEVLDQRLLDWARALDVDPLQPRVVAVIEVDSGELALDEAFQERERLRSMLLVPERHNLLAVVSPTELVVLKAVQEREGGWDLASHRDRVWQLLARVKTQSRLNIRIALGHYFPGQGGLARSYRTATASLRVGKQRQAEAPAYFYQDMVLPVLLEGLHDSWQAAELMRPVLALRAGDAKGHLQQTLMAWVACDMQPLRTAQRLGIHRNTLEYRMGRISALTGLDLNLGDDRLLLYAAVQLDSTRDAR